MVELGMMAAGGDFFLFKKGGVGKNKKQTKRRTLSLKKESSKEAYKSSDGRANTIYLCLRLRPSGFTRLLLASAKFPSPPVRHLLWSSSRASRRLTTRPRRHHLEQTRPHGKAGQRNRSKETRGTGANCRTLPSDSWCVSTGSKSPARFEPARRREMVLYR